MMRVIAWCSVTVIDLAKRHLTRSKAMGFAKCSTHPTRCIHHSALGALALLLLLQPVLLHFDVGFKPEVCDVGIELFLAE